MAGGGSGAPWSGSELDLDDDNDDTHAGGGTLIQPSGKSPKQKRVQRVVQGFSSRSARVSPETSSDASVLVRAGSERHLPRRLSMAGGTFLSSTLQRQDSSAQLKPGNSPAQLNRQPPPTSGGVSARSPNPRASPPAPWAGSRSLLGHSPREVGGDRRPFPWYRRWTRCSCAASCLMRRPPC